MNSDDQPHISDQSPILSSTASVEPVGPAMTASPPPSLSAVSVAQEEDAPVPYAAAKSLIAGAISGAIAKTAVAPFDRTKILMQVSHMYGWTLYRGSVMNCMRTIYNTEGLLGFFRGNTATVARIMPYAAVQYYAFELYHRTLSQHVFKSDAPHPVKRFVAGALAGSTSVLCTYPIDLARTILAVQLSTPSAATTSTATAVTGAGTATTTTTTPKPSSLGVFSTIVATARERGISAIYRGMYPTLVGVVPYAGISFLSFGLLRRAADKRHIAQTWPVSTSLVCGASAGLSKSFTALNPNAFSFPSTEYNVDAHVHQHIHIFVSGSVLHVSFRSRSKAIAGSSQTRPHDLARAGT